MRGIHFSGFVVLILILGIILSGCSARFKDNTIQSSGNSQNANSFFSETNSQSSNAERNISEANNRFAYDLFKKLSDDPENSGKNILFSPFSLSSIMAISYEGARGQTAGEIESVFHFPENISELREGYSEMYSGINREQNTYTLRTANALWAEKTCPFNPGYIQTARTYYHTNATNLDFIGDSENSRTTINNWVEGETDNKIRDLIPSGNIDATTSLVITNAVYFNGKWKRPFRSELTHSRDFHLSSGKTVPVLYMYDSSYFRCAEIDGDEMLQLPYKAGNGKNLSMVFFLPKTNDETTLGNSLNTEKITELKKSLNETWVVVHIPKFKLETQYKLPDTLTKMGMPTAFSSSADFSGMDGKHDLFIRDVIHKAFIDVNEEGTEAAAASLSGYTMGPYHAPALFDADHPFLFIIQDDDDGTILFIGRIMNPNG
jgi:serpin B